jgi:RNA polymerase primary sigma factor
VASLARQYARPSMSFLDLIGDGNLSLMRAVDKFDYARGFKFSTYTSWAIRRGYARLFRLQANRFGRVLIDSEHLLDAAPTSDDGIRRIDLQSTHETLAKALEALSAREQDVLVRHYGLDDGNKPQTLSEIGQMLGLTKERIRQIERRAINKLRSTGLSDFREQGFTRG